MNRQEAIAKGYMVHDVQPSMKRRDKSRDYSRPATYMVTIEVAERKPLLGVLVADPEPHIEVSSLGLAIMKEEIPRMLEHYQMLSVWKCCIMPDHIHMIVRIRENLPEGKTLGSVIGGFKAGCSKAYWKFLDQEAYEAVLQNQEGQKTAANAACTKALSVPPTSVPSNLIFPTSVHGASAPVPPRPSLFAPGFNDRYIKEHGHLDRWKHYLDDNPRRLWLKRLHPDLFTVTRGVDLINKDVVKMVDKSQPPASAFHPTPEEFEAVCRHCNMCGNMFLLRSPEKMAVIVRSVWTDEQFQEMKNKWLACGARGGVLVSASISEREKEVMKEAYERGYSIIRLSKEGFSKLYKPTGRNFDACLSGKLLELSPWQHSNSTSKITRKQCMTLNQLATAIVER